MLSNRALVERIEGEFIPLLVYNNKGGRDAALLKRYGEPSWNYPVVRFIDGEGQDLIPRRDGIFTVEGIEERIDQALQKAKQG